MAHALRHAVTHYIDHLQDAPWVESLVAEHGVMAVLQKCVEVLNDPKTDEIHEVTTLLRDIGLRGIFSDELVMKVRELMPTIVLPALHPLLRAPVLQVRMAAIYTIGKLSFSAEAKTLRQVFPAYLVGDPFCLARLLGELGWLGDRRGVHARLRQIIAHKSYLIRWSALGYLDCQGTDAGLEHRLKSKWLRTLSSDPVSVVAAEARQQLSELKWEVASQKGRSRPKAEPATTFSTIEVQFLNEMARTMRTDYSLEDLDTFVGALATSQPHCG